MRSRRRIAPLPGMPGSSWAPRGARAGICFPGMMRRLAPLPLLLLLAALHEPIARAALADPMSCCLAGGAAICCSLGGSCAWKSCPVTEDDVRAASLTVFAPSNPVELTLPTVGLCALALPCVRLDLGSPAQLDPPPRA